MDLEKGSEREKSLSVLDYMSNEYFSLRQWESYLFQVKAIRSLIDSGNILEIGCGGKIVNTILKKLGYVADTMDINEHLTPTFVGDLSKSDYLPPGEYDCVLCAEVLEHIPFENFLICTKNIQRTTKKYAIITLPNCLTRKIEIGFMFNKHYKEFGFGKKINKIAPMHFWELNSAPYCTNRAITRCLEELFQIKDEGIVMRNRYHYYYLLEK